jgi:IS1 family transposase
MLNWRRDPGYEQRMSENQIAIERSKERTKQIESEILRVRNDSERIEKETEQL